MADIPMGSSRVVKHEIVLPCDGDFLNICFGGQVRSFAALASTSALQERFGLRRHHLRLCDIIKVAYAAGKTNQLQCVHLSARTASSGF